MRNPKCMHVLKHLPLSFLHPSASSTAPGNGFPHSRPSDRQPGLGRGACTVIIHFFLSPVDCCTEFRTGSAAIRCGQTCDSCATRAGRPQRPCTPTNGQAPVIQLCPVDWWQTRPGPRPNPSLARVVADAQLRSSGILRYSHAPEPLNRALASGAAGRAAAPLNARGRVFAEFLHAC
ncbi:hypothetical protein HPP92_009081 [Vanilla planifolia]|uniref:Uncharacterized protein n=1 Tax=Vanilla planifolia TaxID=51239 RepID=A0A835V8I2_VANPL|nr:hypothetical protein HPP92_009081 [Vanilla planifolia]